MKTPPPEHVGHEYAEPDHNHHLHPSACGLLRQRRGHNPAVVLGQGRDAHVSLGSNPQSPHRPPVSLTRQSGCPSIALRSFPAARLTIAIDSRRRRRHFLLHFATGPRVTPAAGATQSPGGCHAATAVTNAISGASWRTCEAGADSRTGDQRIRSRILCLLGRVRGELGLLGASGDRPRRLRWRRDPQHAALINTQSLTGRRPIRRQNGGRDRPGRRRSKPSLLTGRPHETQMSGGHSLLTPK